MELTPERKQQIEEEERQRLAEEQYRARVRAGLNTSPAPSVPQSAPGGSQSKAWKPLAWVLGILAVVIVGAVLISRNIARAPSSDAAGANDTAGARTGGAIPAAPANTPQVRYVPVSQKIATGQIVVRAKGYVRYRFEITPEMREAHVSGHFNASGGAGNDIMAVIATEEEFTNWTNGHEARAFYSTQGKKTTDTFDVSLAPGTYYLGFSNTFSAFHSKDVFLEVDLNYQRMETY
jgi:hypothetical protein